MAVCRGKEREKNCLYQCHSPDNCFLVEKYSWWPELSFSSAVSLMVMFLQVFSVNRGWYPIVSGPRSFPREYPSPVTGPAKGVRGVYPSPVTGPTGGGGGYSSPVWSLVLPWVYPCPGYPLPGYGYFPSPPPNRRASVCYATGGTPLAVTQEDFLVDETKFSNRNGNTCGTDNFVSFL